MFGFTGDDTLTVDSIGGGVQIPDGIRFDGGAGLHNSLQLKNADALIQDNTSSDFTRRTIVT